MAGAAFGPPLSFQPGLTWINTAHVPPADNPAMATSPRPSLSPSLLAAAPHRLLFFVGASNVLLAMLWWAAWLASTRWQWWTMPQPTPMRAGCMPS